ncbi:MAG: hypothetical protein R3C10_20820 [Pirellulales bacterium]|nr:hypothetical protein [Planctomycetales bacterium]
MSDPWFDLDEALWRQHQQDRANELRRRARFRLRTLIGLTIAVSVCFALAVAWGPFLAEEAAFRYRFFAKGMNGKSLTDVFAVPLALWALSLTVVGVIVYLGARIQRH